MAEARYATIISTGEELVSGHTVDTNASFLARHLTENGLRIRRILAVGDDPEALTFELLRVAADSQVVLITGGLGPTVDDRARGAIALAARCELVHDDESLEHVRRVIEGYGHRMTDAHAVQCLFPAGADILPNPRGTACGFACWVGEAMAYAMPGVPEEMKAMFTGSVLPRLTGESRERVVMREVHTSGLPESRVNEALVTLLEIGRNPSVGLKARGGWVTVCIRARAATAEEAERLAEGDCRAVEERLGEAAFGRGEVTLAGALAQVLEERGLHLAVAESCTGGLIGSMLTDVPGVSSVLLLDVVAYDNAAKTRVLGVPAERIEAAGAVSREVAQLMARGACEVSGAEVGLSTTGVAGPAGGTARKPVGLVYVGMCLRGWTAVRELRIPGERQRVKDRAARYALDFARLEVLKESAETGSLGRRRRGEKACG